MGDRSMRAHGHCGARSKALGHKKLKIGKQMFPTQNFTLCSNMPTTEHFKRQGDEQWDRTVSSATRIGLWETNHGIGQRGQNCNWVA